MLTLYFSATGNTKYIAELFSRIMGAKCLSIEADADFEQEIASHDTIAFCYPIYGSRVPRILREFTSRHMSALHGKRIIILVTQMLFSGDGARVFTDMFMDISIEVIYAEHFLMPNNVNNLLILRRQSARTINRYVKKAESKMQRVCRDIQNGIVKKRGFSRFSKVIGSMQGRLWQGDSRLIAPSAKSMEHRAKDGVRIHSECSACMLCVGLCPMKNLIIEEGIVKPQGDCTVCYRCINRCPQKAITIMFKAKPRWQYRGI